MIGARRTRIATGSTRCLCAQTTLCLEAPRSVGTRPLLAASMEGLMQTACWLRHCPQARYRVHRSPERCCAHACPFAPLEGVAGVDSTLMAYTHMRFSCSSFRGRAWSPAPAQGAVALQHTQHISNHVTHTPPQRNASAIAACARCATHRFKPHISHSPQHGMPQRISRSRPLTRYTRG